MAQEQLAKTRSNKLHDRVLMVKELFNSIDTNHDGKVTMAELTTYLVEVAGRIVSDPNAEEILQEMGIPVEAWSSQMKLRRIFEDLKASSTHEGYITEEEFIAAYYRQRLTSRIGNNRAFWPFVFGAAAVLTVAGFTGYIIGKKR